MDNRTKAYKKTIADRINTGMIVERLHKHVQGEIEMSATQINAARILLAKVVPDQSASSHSVTVRDDTKPREEHRDRARQLLKAVN